jgi:hypothetical protein
MKPIEAYKILKEHKTSQDNLIGIKATGLIIANSVLLLAFFGRIPEDKFVVPYCVLPVIGLVLCLAAIGTLFGDTRARARTLKSLRKIESEPDFLYLKAIQSRPITDVEDVARWYAKHPRLESANFFWPIFPAFFMVVWVFLLKGV